MIDLSMEDTPGGRTEPALNKIANELRLKLGPNPISLSSQMAQAPKR